MSSAEDNEPAASETPVDSSTNAADSASATDAGADPEPAAADGESPAEGAAPSETNTTEETVEVVQVNVVVTEEETPKSKIKSSDGTKAKSSDGTKAKSSDGTQAKSSDGTKVKSVASGSIDKIKSKTKPSSKTDDEGETGGEAETDDSATAITPTKSKSKDSKSSINEEAKKGSMKKVKVGFFGAGRMTDSITKGLLKSGKFQAKQLYVTKKSKRNLDYYKSQGMHVSTRGYDVFAKFACDVIFIAVNGYVIKNCFKQGGTRPLPLVTNYIPSRKRKSYVLSLVGGISLKELKVVLLNPEVSEKRYPVHFHRITMNVSVAYNLGLGALDVELDSKKCSSVVRELLQLLGKFEYVDAELMDTTCAVVGMGQAFVYYFISSLADGGFKMGLSKNVAVKMAAKTLQAAAMCLLETNKNPVDLRDACAAPTSPIIYGIALLEKQDCSSGFQMAVDAAYMRIKQLVDTDIDTRQKP